MTLRKMAGPLVLAASVAVRGAQNSVFAADDSNNETAAAPNEVVITSQHEVASSGTKSNTPLIETPQAITVIDRSELDLRVVQGLNEATHFTAGIGPDTRGNTAGRYDQMTLRGFTPDQYLDGLKLLGSVNGYAVPQIDLAFLDRVEILKGPASGLYGQASPGGIIALSSKLPVLDRFEEFGVSGGSYGTVRGSFDMGGRIDDAGQFSYRISGTANRSDTQTNFVESDRFGISPALTWRPDDATSWTLLYHFQHDPKTGDYGAMPVQGSLLPNPNGRIPRDFYDGEAGYERFDRRQNGITSLFTRRFGDWSFHQNTRFLHVGTIYRSVYQLGFQPDLINLYRSIAVADEALDSLTLDNQLTGSTHTGILTHDIIAGVDYQRTHQTEAAGFGGNVDSLNAFAPVYGSAIIPPDISFNVRLIQHQTGVYAQDQIALDSWRLVLSGRHDWVKSDQLDRLRGGTASLDKKKLTGRAGLLYLLPGGFAPYVSYSTSFQPQTATDRNGQVLQPTQGKQAEAGLKYQPAGGNTLLTAAVYDLRQTNVATQDPGVPFGLGSIAAGEVRSRGVELEAATRPIEPLEIRASYTYLDNKVTKDNTGLVGTRPYGIPQQTANGYALYKVQEGPMAGVGIGGAVRYLGRNFNGTAGTDALTIPGATLFDVLGSYDFGKLNPRAAGLTLNLDVTNVFNRTYISSCYAALWCWYGASRNVQASLRYKM